MAGSPSGTEVPEPVTSRCRSGAQTRRVPEREDLVAEHVVAGREVGGDLDGPRVAGGNELVGRPVAGVRAVDQAALGDLDEREALLVDGGAVGVAGRDVVDHGAVVALGPGVPLQRDGAAGGDGGVVVGGDGALVADDVRVGEGAGLDEAVVLVVGGPAGGRGVGAAGDAAGVLDAVGDDGLDVAVGVGERREGDDREGLHGGHFCVVFGLGMERRIGEVVLVVGWLVSC